MEDKNRSAVVTGPTIVSMEGGSLQDFDDVTDCTLIASLNADLEASRFTHSQQWFNSYGSCLDWIGWEPVGDSYTQRRDTISGNVVQTYLTSLSSRQNTKLGSSVINLLIDSFDAVKGNGPAIYSLDQETARGELFQVTPFWRDGAGKLRMQVSRLKLVASVKSGQFLFFEMDDDSASLLQHYAEFVLNEARLNEKRQRIQQKLKENRMARFKLRLTSSQG
ncbi:hypothetical protein [Pseudomonas sp. ANT_H12B]|uniref:hypothetical protein n=1 Tax=Pseudomonas sp. ANT_H12B TaxID=2597348 RepID=UPI0011EC8BC9|nr:hypothetical protein [Pseudomonas sp. ANT_H12B]KAA0967715.1 hypothetical protein FQ185_22345 [Pseudomonas sp. ANT_H12B]